MISKAVPVAFAVFISFVAPLSAIAADDLGAQRECLQQHVLLSDASVRPGAYVGHNVAVSVTNNLSWPIAGIRFSYQAFSEGRAVPWVKDDVSILIAGGIEPGETREVVTTARVPSDAPDALLVRGQILDVADQYERQLIRDVRVIGWGDGLSDHACD